MASGKKKGCIEYMKTSLKETHILSSLLIAAKSFPGYTIELRIWIKMGVDCEVIAIWKHPLEIALSLMKRGGLNNFGKVWIDYYNNLNFNYC